MVNLTVLKFIFFNSLNTGRTAIFHAR